MFLPDRQHSFAVLGVEDLSHSAVNGAKAAEDAHVAGCQMDSVDTGEVTDGEQEKEQSQGAKDHLGDSVMFQGANEHKQAENPPQQQVEAQGSGITGGDTFKGREPNQDQRPPEKAIGHKSRAAEGIMMDKFQDTGDDLGGSAQGEAHGDDDDGQGDDLRIVEIEQNGRHAKAQQPQRARIGVIQFFSGHKFLLIMVWLVQTLPPKRTETF